MKLIFITSLFLITISNISAQKNDPPGLQIIKTTDLKKDYMNLLTQNLKDALQEHWMN